MKKLKPINMLDTRMIRPERAAVVDAIQELAVLGRIPQSLPVNDFGHYRDHHWLDKSGRLRPHLSVDWYVANAWDAKRKMVNGSVLMRSLAEEPWRREEIFGDHYDLLILDEELLAEEGLEEAESAVSVSQHLIGTIISASALDRLNYDMYALLKTAALHGFGHAFGLPDLRRDDIDFTHGLHCRNRCVMRHAPADAEAWQKLTEDRLVCGPLCERCVQDLRRFFAEGDAALPRE
ncbi:MAG: hypothetical protein FJ279_03770 [Planctomycetes bacterium]|nr:hypothetical protein [Planctomycetota bacterium]MBM4084408.1 hypothetical protein [Planctomycetota bacterium]